jgi:hypothetical protein
MKYLQKFESLKTDTWLDRQYSSLEEVAEVIFEYSQLSDRDEDVYWDIHGLLFDYVDDDLEYVDVDFTKAQLIQGLKKFFDNASYGVIESFLDRFDTIDSKIYNSWKNSKKNDFTLEDVEDLFMVNPDFKVSCLKASYGFSILIENVMYQDVLEYSQRYWYEIPKRVPENLELTKVTIEKTSNQNYIFNLEIRKKSVN